MSVTKSSYGGKREGAGRKPKVEELALIERLSPLDDIAMKALENGVRSGELGFVKLFMEYRFGKPKESVELKGGLTIQWQEEKTYAPNDQAD